MAFRHRVASRQMFRRQRLETKANMMHAEPMSTLDGQQTLAKRNGARSLAFKACFFLFFFFSFFPSWQFRLVSVQVIRQCVEVSRQWLELRRLLVDHEGRRERERECEESIYIQKESGGKTH